MDRLLLVIGWIVPALVAWILSRPRSDANLLAQASADIDLARKLSSANLQDRLRDSAERVVRDVLDRRGTSRRKAWIAGGLAGIAAGWAVLAVVWLFGAYLSRSHYYLASSLLALLLAVVVYCVNKARVNSRSRSRHVSLRAVMLGGPLVALMTFVLGFAAVREASRVLAALDVSGSATCVNGGPVLGIYVKPDSGDEGFARWEPQSGNQGRFHYSRSRLSPWRVNVGCGAKDSTFITGSETTTQVTQDWVCDDAPSSPTFGCRTIQAVSNP